MVVTFAAPPDASRLYNIGMAAPFVVMLADLPAAEHNEIAKIVNEKPGAVWISDAGDGMLPHAILLVVVLGGVVAGIVELARSHDYVSFLASTAGTGFILASIALPLLLWWIRGLNGRFGWMVTSFGLVQIRGERLKIARWQDIVKVRRSIVGTGINRFVSLDITTAQGELVCNSGALFSELRERLPPTAQLVNEDP